MEYEPIQGKRPKILDMFIKCDEKLGGWVVQDALVASALLLGFNIG